MKKDDNKLRFEFEIFDDLMDAFERVRSSIWRAMQDCKDLENNKLLMQSYLNLLNVQCTIIRNSKVVKIWDTEE